MRINNRKLNDFNGIFVSFTYVPSSLNMNIGYYPNRHILIGKVLTTKLMQLVIVFESDKDIGEFAKEIYGHSVIDIDDSYKYDCIITDTPATHHIGAGIYQMTYILSAIKKGNERSLKLARNNNLVDIDGTGDCGVIYEIVPRYDGEISVGGYTVKNIHRGKKIVIDGINMTIEEDGVNKFIDSNLKKFPELVPGKQFISVSNLNADITLRYYPIYL